MANSEGRDDLERTPFGETTFIGTQAEVAVAGQATPELNFAASVGVFDP